MTDETFERTMTEEQKTSTLKHSSETLIERDHIRITSDTLDLTTLLDFVKTPASGALSCFVGTTRDFFEGKEVLQLEYECYPSMAVSELRRLCKRIRERFSTELHGIAIEHRTGVVPVKEESVMIVISSQHRREAIRAVEYAIDEIKTRVPIWKKEVYRIKDGEGSLSSKPETEAIWKVNKEFAFLKKDTESSMTNAGKT